jgi:hypothetical protein
VTERSNSQQNLETVHTKALQNGSPGFRSTKSKKNTENQENKRPGGHNAWTPKASDSTKRNGGEFNYKQSSMLN